jgi:hypothetical protein
MKTKPQQLEVMLSRYQFRLAWVDLDEGTIKFVRPSHHKGLYEWVDLLERGRNGEVLDMGASVSVVKHRPFWKGLGDSKAIVDFANVPDRAETVVRSYKERIEWLMKICAVAPERCRFLADTAGVQVLEKTLSARNAARLYFDCLNHVESLSQASVRLEAECAPKAVEHVKEALPSIAWVYWREVFFLAALTMSRFGDRVEPQRPPFDSIPVPSQDRELMWRLILLVDLLITEFAVNRKDLPPPPWLFGGEGGPVETYQECGDDG